MESVMKKIVQLLALTLLAMCANHAPAAAADQIFPCGAGGTYFVTTFNSKIAGHNNCSGSVTVDASVLGIGMEAFKGSLITEVFIPDTVKVIDFGAFSDTPQLKTIRFPSNLEEIPNWIFDRSAIQEIEIPSSVRELGFYAFQESNIKKYYFCGPLWIGRELPIPPICKEDIDAAAAIQAKQDAKKLTISCVKGSVTKKVRGESPNCPKGYINPMAKYLTFQAFSKCQLYKKDAPEFNASLSNSGKTLYIKNPYNYDPNRLFGDKPAQVSFQDLDCAFDYMGANERVRDVYSYRASKGVRTIRWGRITLKFETPFFGLTYYTFTQN